MEFEYNVLIGIKKDYEEYIRINRDIYKETRLCLRYIEYRDKVLGEIEYIKKCVEQFGFIEDTYRNKLINYQIREYMYKRYERVKDLEEEVKYINLKIEKLRMDVHIQRTYEFNESEIRRIETRLSELKV
jgi:hypothetical protein